MTSDPEHDAKPRALTDRVANRPVTVGELVTNTLRNEELLVASAFATVRTRRGLFDGIEAGAMAVFPLVAVHGFLALVAVFRPDAGSLIIHGGLTGLAILAHHAVLHGRTAWPSVFILTWLLVEIICGAWLFDYRIGSSILNVIGLPFAILGVRASWRRAQLAKAPI